MWCIPKQQSHHFVAGMERVLKVYRRPYDPRHPVVCMDEMSKQPSVGSPREVAGTPRVAGEVRRPLPPPGRMHGLDVRRAAVRLAESGCHQTAHDVGLGEASARTGESAAFYRDAESITLVCDNLNTHSGDSFYAAFPAGRSQSAERPHPLGAHAETRELAERCGTGVQCVAPPVPGSSDREQGFGHVGNGGLGRGAQSRTDRGQLAAQRRRRAHQTEASIPEN